MKSDVRKYEKALKHCLPFGRVIRKRLIASFRSSLMTFAEEECNPDTLALYAAFGPPSEMAKLLTSSLTEEEIKRSHKQKITARIFTGIGIIAAALMLALVAFAIMFYYQPITVIEQNIDYGTISTTIAENTTP